MWFCVVVQWSATRPSFSMSSAKLNLSSSKTLKGIIPVSTATTAASTTTGTIAACVHVLLLSVLLLVLTIIQQQPHLLAAQRGIPMIYPWSFVVVHYYTEFRCC